MTTLYLSQQPVDDFGLRFSDLKFCATIAADTNTQLVIPGNANFYKAIIKSQGEMWVAINATAAFPTDNSFVATASELINGNIFICREVRQGDTLNFYTAGSDIDVSVILYSLGT